MTRTIAVITAGTSQPSSTRLLADRLSEATDRGLRLHQERADIVVIELRELAHDLTNQLLSGFAGGALLEAQETVAGADAVIAVTPIFSASYSGLFKTFFDVLEPDTLAGKPVLIAATAGTARHSLALEFAVRPLFAYLKALVVPTAVFAATEDFGGRGPATDAISPDTRPLAERVDLAGRELAELVTGRSGRAQVDPFENPTPFADLLAGGGS